MRFFDRFRQALSRYHFGVHDLGAPATAAALDEAERRLGRKLPAALRELLSQWNGAYLFHDDYALHGVEGARPELAVLAASGDLLRIGAAPTGALFLDDKGRVLSVEEDAGDGDDGGGEARVEGSELERWLDAVMAREALVYDAEGEFRDEAFDGGDLSARARRKRAQVAAKADPAAPAWHEELAEIHLEEGHPDRALAELEQAVRAGAEGETPSVRAALAPTWMQLGSLRRQLGAPGAREAFVRAAEAYADPREAAFAWSLCAREAREAGDLDSAAHAAGETLSRAPDFVAEQRAAAAHLARQGDLDDALERLGLALAVAPDDAESLRLAALTRGRKALKPR